MLQVDLAKALLDLAAAAAVVRHAGRTAVVGFCWGGLISWLAACQQPLSAAVSYYGTRIGQHLTQTPQCPMMLHFGEQDAAVPPDEVERIRAAYPQGIFHLYATGHAFANSDRPSYNAAMAKLARSRTDAFLRAHIG
jgi:carboxymethylenebutenolidase